MILPLLRFGILDSCIQPAPLGGLRAIAEMGIVSTVSLPTWLLVGQTCVCKRCGESGVRDGQSVRRMSVAEGPRRPTHDAIEMVWSAIVFTVTVLQLTVTWPSLRVYIPYSTRAVALTAVSVESRRARTNVYHRDQYGDRWPSILVDPSLGERPQYTLRRFSSALTAIPGIRVSSIG